MRRRHCSSAQKLCELRRILRPFAPCYVGNCGLLGEYRPKIMIASPRPSNKHASCFGSSYAWYYGCAGGTYTATVSVGASVKKEFQRAQSVVNNQGPTTPRDSSYKKGIIVALLLTADLQPREDCRNRSLNAAFWHTEHAPSPQKNSIISGVQIPEDDRLWSCKALGTWN